MIRRVLVGIAGATLAIAGLPYTLLAQNAQTCTNNCAQVKVEGGSGNPGDTITAKLSFNQGPSTGQAGGIDKIAALALTMTLAPAGSSATPVTLADCTLNADGLPGAVKPDAALANFKVVVENASCANGRTHCLCPDAGQTKDNFINIVVYGPNPLPTPGPNPIDIPVLPSGQLLTIDLKGSGGNIPLHIYNQATAADSTHPQFTALLSVGDKQAVDQTCVPVQGQPPCSAAGSVSQVTVVDGILHTGTPSCVGDCDGMGDVTVDELLKMVNIALGLTPVSDCAAGDSSMDGQITVDEILSAVQNALNGCPTA